jgi:hypothetical protein
MCMRPQPGDQVVSIRCQPIAYPYPTCGCRGHRKRRRDRFVRSLAYGCVLWLHVFHAEYTATRPFGGGCAFKHASSASSLVLQLLAPGGGVGAKGAGISGGGGVIFSVAGLLQPILHAGSVFCSSATPFSVTSVPVTSSD